MNTPSHSYATSPYRTHRILLTAASLLASAAAHAAPLLAPGDPIFAYDLDTAGGNTGNTAFATVNYPPGEAPGFAIDGSPATKYLNFCRHTSGIIVTPTTAAAAQSLVLTTANDSPERDPASYIILGTNHPITSADKSNGFADNWTFIAQGTLTLPTTRGTVAAPINFPNSTAFSSYWIVFPSVRNLTTSNSMQIAEIQLTTGTNGTGDPIFSPGNPVLATGWNSAVAAGEIVTRTIDGNPSTKYLNFGENNSGFFVVPTSGRSIIDSFQLTTANDADVRDPATWQIHGMDDSGIWSLLGSGSVTLPVARGAAGPIVSFSNTTICRAYRMTFTTVKNATSANSMQVAEAQFFGIIVPAKDTDNDLMDDDWETLYGLIVGVNDAAGDLDSDASPNVQEYQRGTLPNKADTDNDGLTDGVETDTGTFVSATNTGSKPLNADTDGDTYTDGYEVAYGTDPNVASAVPTITWDITPGDSTITGGTGTWDDLTTANWTTDNGATNVPWNNAGQRQAAIFGGTAGTVTLAAPITADRVIVNTAGYVFNGSTLTLGSSAPSSTSPPAPPRWLSPSQAPPASPNKATARSASPAPATPTPAPPPSKASAVSSSPRTPARSPSQATSSSIPSPSSPIPPASSSGAMNRSPTPASSHGPTSVRPTPTSVSTASPKPSAGSSPTASAASSPSKTAASTTPPPIQTAISSSTPPPPPATSSME
jgi:hypothetical protein